MKKYILSTLFLAMSIAMSAQNIFRTTCQGNLKRLDSLLLSTDINTRDTRGRSLLHWAVACKKRAVFDALVQRGININAEDLQQKTPMHVAVQYALQEYLDVLVSLQPTNAWIDHFGPSLLEPAILNRDLSLVKKLTAFGMDLNRANARGSTPLEISKRIGAYEITAHLLTMGADPGLVRSFKMEGEYMGRNRPETHAEVFAPNFISTEEQQFGSVFNAAGTEFYYGVVVNGKNEIRYTELSGNQWIPPVTLLSDIRYGYNDPFLSPDEKRLYFISDQALDGKGEPKDIDIWYVEIFEDGWSDPIHTGDQINTIGDEYYISFTDQGTMYFSSNGHSSEDPQNADHDIYTSRFIDNTFQKPVRLGEAINSDAYEADVYVAPDESYLIFCSTRENGFGQGDLYISFKRQDGTWKPAMNLGDTINTPQYEYCPFVTKDGKFLLFTRGQDIYWVSTEVIDNLR